MNSATRRYIQNKSTDETILYAGRLLLSEEDLKELPEDSKDNLIISIKPSDVPGVYTLFETLCDDGCHSSEEFLINSEIVRSLCNYFSVCTKNL